MKPWIQLIRCIECDQPRPLTIDSHAGIRRAVARSCWQCYLRRHQGPADPDWVVVDRLVSGQLAGGWRQSSRSERVAAVAALTEIGLSAAQIAQRVHVTQRSVVRLRSATRVAG